MNSQLFMGLIHVSGLSPSFTSVVRPGDLTAIRTMADEPIQTEEGLSILEEG